MGNIRIPALSFSSVCMVYLLSSRPDLNKQSHRQTGRQTDRLIINKGYKLGRGTFRCRVWQKRWGLPSE